MDPVEGSEAGGAIIELLWGAFHLVWLRTGSGVTVAMVTSVGVLGGV